MVIKKSYGKLNSSEKWAGMRDYEPPSPSRPCVIKKLCEQISIYPSKDPKTMNLWQVMVNVRLGVGVYLLTFIDM